MTPAKPWHYTVAVIVFLFVAFSYGKSVFTGVSREKAKATVLYTAAEYAKLSNARLSRMDLSWQWRRRDAAWLKG